MAVGLQKGLFGDVLGVVVVADAVVGVGVDVAEVVAIKLLEGSVELGLRLTLVSRALIRVGQMASVLSAAGRVIVMPRVLPRPVRGGRAPPA